MLSINKIQELRIKNIIQQIVAESSHVTITFCDIRLRLTLFLLTNLWATHTYRFDSLTACQGNCMLDNNNKTIT